MGHVVLLGNSIFDNAAYVGGAPDVARQLTAELGDGWAVSLRARDGDTVADVESQLRRLPPDVTHLVVSAGGNDALRQSAVLAERAASVGDAVARLAGVRRVSNGNMAPCWTGCPNSTCLLPSARSTMPTTRPLWRGGQGRPALFDDAITRAAAARRLALIDLRLVAASPATTPTRLSPRLKAA